MRIFKSLQSALFFAFIGIAIVMGLVFVWFAFPQIKNNEYRQITRELFTQTALSADQISHLIIPSKGQTKLPAQKQQLQSFVLKLSKQSLSRVTIINPDGVVMADSATPIDKISKLENHSNRPEVIQAKKTGKGSAVRYSETLKKDLIYTAQAIKNSKGEIIGYLRFSAPSTSAEFLANQIYLALLFAFLVSIVAAVAISLYFSRVFAQPIANLSKLASRIAKGEYPQSILHKSRYEVGALETALEEMSQNIADNIKKYSEEKSKLAALLDSTAEGVLAVDQNGKIIFANPVIEKGFGVEEKQIVGKGVIETLRNSEIGELIARVLRTQEKSEEEISSVLPVEATFAAQAAPMIDAAGHKSGAVCVLFDITKMKRLERYRSEFVANVSHELKTPLTIIRNYVDTLLEGGLEDQANNRKFLEKIENSAENLQILINDILELSHLENKNEIGNITDVDLLKVANHAFESISEKAQKKGVVLTKELTAAPIIIKGVEESLYRAIFNLLDNAVNYTAPEKGVVLKAAVADHQVIISVIDEGIGIPEKSLPRIFERFYRVDPARSREIGGTGLGLAIVKHAVEAHGGRVEVESAEGQGSTFRIYLPVT